MKKLTSALIFLLIAKTSPIYACAVCAGSGFPVQTIKGYVNATVFLAAMPFAVAGVLFFVALHFRTKR